MTSTMRRFLAPLACLLALLAVVVVPAAPASADFAGDLKTVQVGLVDAAGKKVGSIARGQSVRVQYTITNTLSYPVKITGVDSEAIANRCVGALTRKTRSTDPNHVFPLYLRPGQTTQVLLDEEHVLAKDSRCSSVSLKRWKGNVLAEKVDKIPESASPTPTMSVTGSALPTAPAPTTTELPPTETQPGFDWTPVLAVGGSTIVLFGLLLLIFGRRR